MTKLKRIKRGRQVLAMAALSGGLALGGYGIASASTSSTTAATATTPAVQPGAPWGGGPHGGGTVSAVTSTSLTVTSPDGTSTTYALTSSTTYLKGRTTASFAELATGEHVAIQVASQGSTTATSVMIIEPVISGTIHSISGSTLVIQDQQGFWRTVTTSSSTTYTEAGSTISASSLQVGNRVAVGGTVASDHTTMAADTVTVMLPHYMGKVTAVSGNTITITTPAGTQQTINVSSTTTYATGRPGANTSSSLSAVTVGTYIDVEGTVTATNVMSAASVHLLQGQPGFGPQGHGGPGGGPGGHGGPGGGPGGLA